jgi:DNA ligase D-like protein (predicted 3'-phosphoesterase)
VNKLRAYRDKRDFRRTPEPKGRAGASKRDRPRFVIQKHDASTLHYDFRLEADGVLKSWAVPKGPSTNPKDKQLAVRTEDHPIEYMDFEGVIPEDEYGGGSVIVWDAGSYGNLSERRGEEISVADAIDRGHVSVWLEGKKLSGGYALTRFRGEEQWLLVKMNDDEADARRNPTRSQPESVLSGRTIEDVAREEGNQEAATGEGGS